MIKIAIAGIGSPLGDDQVGWEVIRLLLQNPRIKKANAIFTDILDRPQLNLCHFFEKAEHFYLIDAMKNNQALGTITQLHAQDILQTSRLLSTHGFGVTQALKLADSLGLLPKHLVIYGIEIGPKQPEGSTLHYTVAAAAEKLAQRLLEDIFH